MNQISINHNYAIQSSYQRGLPTIDCVFLHIQMYRTKFNKIELIIVIHHANRHLT